MTEVINSTNLANRRKAFAGLALGAIGVVYGDIGTSPLYAVQTTFGEQGIPPTSNNVLGVLSLMFWSLVMVVSLKYVVFIMRADNKGEGGIMALMALAQRSARGNVRARWWIMILGLLGASLFYGDGVIHAGDFGVVRGRRSESRRARAVALGGTDYAGRHHRPVRVAAAR